MARFMNLWRINPSAPWPTDPSKLSEFMEMMWKGMDERMKKGEIEEWGTFPEGYSGYSIDKAETIDIYRGTLAFYPYIISEIHEIIPYEKAKENIRAHLKAQIAAMKK